MANEHRLSRIDLHLVKILHTLLLTHSVSQSALRLGMHQPAVSTALARLRELTGDAILVRAGRAMVPTDTARALLAPASDMLSAAERLFAGHAGSRFEAASTERVFRVAASDYLDPQFLPLLVADIKRAAPLAGIEILPLTADADYRQRLAAGEIDLVVGNWLAPPADLHIGRLFQDEIVCLVANRHPMVRRGWTMDKYLACEHVAPTPTHPGARGVIDDLLAQSGLRRRISVRCPHFALTPAMVADSLLVLTTGRLFCTRFTATLPVRIVPCPVPMPALKYYQLWHDRTQQSDACKWLREQVRRVAARLK
jgi:DNA-binding transcriptional LysR family regulator